MTTMEDLTKTQIVLLTLLVSFITSIATGIITTSLLAQAPQGVTQTIDRVVERTVERVAPTNTGGTTVREVTVVKEGDAIVGAVETATKAVVKINSPATAEGIQNFYALGVIVGKGLVLTDKRNIDPNGTYSVVLSDGTSIQANAYAQSESGSLALFKLNADDSKLRSLPVISISSIDPKLGQTIVAMQGRERASISVGRVLSIDTGLGIASTDISALTEVQGGPLLNLNGELIGMKTSNADLTLSAGSYSVASALSRFVAAHQ